MININKPSLIIDSLKVKLNIQNMIAKLDDVKNLRPHFKTHQSKDVSNIIQRGGTILKSSRSKEFLTVEGRKKAAENQKSKFIMNSDRLDNYLSQL